MSGNKPTTSPVSSPEKQSGASSQFKNRLRDYVDSGCGAAVGGSTSHGDNNGVIKAKETVYFHTA